MCKLRKSFQLRWKMKILQREMNEILFQIWEVDYYLFSLTVLRMSRAGIHPSLQRNAKAFKNFKICDFGGVVKSPWHTLVLLQILSAPLRFWHQTSITLNILSCHKRNCDVALPCHNLLGAQYKYPGKSSAEGSWWFS